MRDSVDFDFFSRKKIKLSNKKKVYQVNMHTMCYLWTKYLKLRFLGLEPLFPDLTRWLGTAALNASFSAVFAFKIVSNSPICDV